VTSPAVYAVLLDALTKLPTLGLKARVLLADSIVATLHREGYTRQRTVTSPAVYTVLLDALTKLPTLSLKARVLLADSIVATLHREGYTIQGDPRFSKPGQRVFAW
jgi:hypothetical protein